MLYKTVIGLLSLNVLGGIWKCISLEAWMRYRCHSFTQSRYTSRHLILLTQQIRQWVVIIIVVIIIIIIINYVEISVTMP